MDALTKKQPVKNDRERELKSIRRQSFVEAYGIKEEGNDSDSDESVDFLTALRGDVASSFGEDGDTRSDDGASQRNHSFTIDDLTEADLAIPTSVDDSNAEISLLGSFARLDTDLKSSDSKVTDDASPPKNFAGGKTRRKGDKNRRMRQRLPPEHRRASTGTALSGMEGSFGGSFGESLASFTSINSFSSSVTGDPTKNIAVGNLVFVSDAEMEEIMYGDDDERKCDKKPFEDSRRRSSVSSVSSNFTASLPPSATLGTGAFSTVRLAWRKTPDHIKEVENKRASFDNIAMKKAEVELRQRNKVQGLKILKNEAVDEDSGPPEDKGELVAVKIMQKSILKKMKTIQKGANNRITVLTAFDNIEREIATMKRLHHPNLVRLFEVIDSESSDRLHMVLEYVSLGEILSNVEGTNQYARMRYRKKVKGLVDGGHFDEKHAALYFVDIMHGLAYLHRNRICHRDLKPENILLTASGIVKISDFGVSHIFEEEKRTQSYLLSVPDDDSLDDLLSDTEDDDFSMKVDNENDGPTLLTKRESDAALSMGSKFNRGTLTKTEGTWCFWSPEMCSAESKGFSGYASDLWAAGVCLYIFSTGQLPFFSMNPNELFEMIATGEVPYEGLGLSDQLMDLLNKMLDKDPATRAGLGDCLKHVFCAEARVERINELGNRMNESEEHIILSKNDVDMALSVAMRPKYSAFRKPAKRSSAPASSFSSPPPADPSARKLMKTGPSLTAVTEKSIDKKDASLVEKCGKSDKKSFIPSKFKKKWFGKK